MVNDDISLHLNQYLLIYIYVSFLSHLVSSSGVFPPLCAAGSSSAFLQAFQSVSPFTFSSYLPVFLLHGKHGPLEEGIFASLNTEFETFAHVWAFRCVCIQGGGVCVCWCMKAITAV